MYYNELNQPFQQTSKTQLMPQGNDIRPIIMASLAIGTVGIAVVTVGKALKNRKNSENEQLDEGFIEDEINGQQDFERFDERLNEPLPTVDSDCSDSVENMSNEELQKEMIRQTMSELGKRSAAARAKKTANDKAH